MDPLTVIEYKYNEKITPEQLSQVFLASKLIRPTDDYPRLQKMINHADILFTAWNGDQLVGVARAVTDFSYCCYLSDLAVDKSYQKEGIGKTLLQLLKERIGEKSPLFFSRLLMRCPIILMLVLKISTMAFASPEKNDGQAFFSGVFSVCACKGYSEDRIQLKYSWLFSLQAICLNIASLHLPHKNSPLRETFISAHINDFDCPIFLECSF